MLILAHPGNVPLNFLNRHLYFENVLNQGNYLHLKIKSKKKNNKIFDSRDRVVGYCLLIVLLCLLICNFQVLYELNILYI